MGKKPAIRFEAYKGEWKQCNLSMIANKVFEKNTDLRYLETFTNSAEKGIVSQQDYFDHAISKLESIAGYYVVNDNDFVYNPRISVTAPVGPINRNKLGRSGVMSPLYTVFSSHDIDPAYLEWYFKSAYWHPYMRLNGNTGARYDRFSISDKMFFQMPIPTPDIEEQKLIAHHFEQLDLLITLQQSNYEKMVVTKKSMLDKLFPQGAAKVPAIRFEGFVGDWEQHKFNDVFDFLQNNTLSRAELGNAQSKVMNIHYGDILVRYGAILDVKKDKLTYLLNDSLVKKYQTSLLRNGDLVIADAAEDETVGKCSEIAGLTDEEVLAGLHTIPCRPKGKFAEGFIGYYMNSNSYHDQLLPLIQGTKVSSVSKASIQDTYIVYPSSELEQKQIADYLKSMDDLIELYRIRVEKLKNIKAACLQGMFV